jgi:hypothetical protein
MGGLSVLVPIAAGAVVYAAAVLLLRAITKEEIQWVRKALLAVR